MFGKEADGQFADELFVLAERATQVIFDRSRTKLGDSLPSAGEDSKATRKMVTALAKALSFRDAAADAVAKKSLPKDLVKRIPVMVGIMQETCGSYTLARELQDWNDQVQAGMRLLVEEATPSMQAGDWSARTGMPLATGMIRTVATMAVMPDPDDDFEVELDKPY